MPITCVHNWCSFRWLFNICSYWCGMVQLHKYNILHAVHAMTCKSLVNKHEAKWVMYDHCFHFFECTVSLVVKGLCEVTVIRILLKCINYILNNYATAYILRPIALYTLLVIIHGTPMHRHHFTGQRIPGSTIISLRHGSTTDSGRRDNLLRCAGSDKFLYQHYPIRR